ncbi:MAG: NAD(P)H-dependent glycerol-3-phosphate dehydrogenase [Myxococcota bacterium]|nr:NAD(P)H-dependent glycerol-3-phosphate dehydrogenase [Myxococcota bacterium]
MTHKPNISVLGAGSFGTALADVCSHLGHSVLMWSQRPEIAQSINARHENPKYFPDLTLHKNLRASTDYDEACAFGDWIIVALPSHALRKNLKLMDCSSPKPLILACKGLEKDSLYTMHEVALDVLGPQWRSSVVALSGPSFARELLEKRPTALVVAGPNQTLLDEISTSLFCPYFRLYTNPDIVGVEFGGALKNVIAIGAGVVSGMGLGDNSRASLVTRGLSEITRLATARGANPLTLGGLAGVGDLILTCTGKLSRNRYLGELLGEGLPAAEALSKIGQVVEGVHTSHAAFDLATRLNVETSVIRNVHEVISGGKSVNDALRELTKNPSGKELRPPLSESLDPNSSGHLD